MTARDLRRLLAMMLLALGAPTADLLHAVSTDPAATARVDPAPMAGWFLQPRAGHLPPGGEDRRVVLDLVAVRRPQAGSAASRFGPRRVVIRLRMGGVAWARISRS